VNPRETGRIALVFAQREFRTLLRTRTIAVLAVGYFSVIVGLVVAAGTGGYLPLTLDLLRPVEVLVPVLAFAFGYRAIFADAQRGELETIRTYPVSRTAFVGGVYLGRLAGFLWVVLAPLLVGAVLVATSPSEQVTVVSAHETVDSPAIYLRFVTLTAVFGLVTLAIATAVSAVARSTREALALVTVLFIALVVGFDATIVAALSGGIISAEQVEPLLVFSPNSAFRGLVLSVAVGDVYTRGAMAGSPIAYSIGLAAWFVVSLAAAMRTAWRT
jgi:Cu-processing system permease protein